MFNFLCAQYVFAAHNSNAAYLTVIVVVIAVSLSILSLFNVLWEDYIDISKRRVQIIRIIAGLSLLFFITPSSLVSLQAIFIEIPFITSNFGHIRYRIINITPTIR
jgi:hypothetical protein